MSGVNEIRSAFLNYFAKNGHEIVPSSSLVPDNDPTLLFTNAGMVQFKNVFTGVEKRPYARATTSQKCVRAGGKHNDLDNVGYTARHHTFFEMLGNFSFGDYFKDRAIELAWNLVTKEFGLPKDKLTATVYIDDDEAFNLWKKIAGLPESRIIRIDGSDNFWQMGDTGPCGPCSEIFYDHGDKVWGGPPGSLEQDGDRFIEIWNLVFMQFEQIAPGQRNPLPKPSIDTGAGLERIAAVLQGKHDNYDIDLFVALIQKIAELTGVNPKGPHKASFRVIADHLRASSFLIADGVLPENEGRGYVLRRIMRRAIRHAQTLDPQRPLIWRVVPTLLHEMGQAYPELIRARDLIAETLEREEINFRETLGRGLNLLESAVESYGSPATNVGASESTPGATAGKILPGHVAFLLQDTYGFPLDLTQDVLRAKGWTVDVSEFNVLMEQQRAKARAAWVGSGDTASETIWFGLREKLGSTNFLGYKEETAEGRVAALVKDGKEVNALVAGESGAIVLDRTPFYAESGGQVGDTGVLTRNDVKFRVTDTQKRAGDLFVHLGKVEQGTLRLGMPMHLEVDHARRALIRANHSATHLLHEALRQVLGDHISQRGSLVAPDRLRFDFVHPKPITSAELARIEDIANEVVLENDEVTTRLMAVDDARNAGARALFGEKYGAEVRVVSMGRGSREHGHNALGWSVELCGGTHVRRTGDIGLISVVGESGVSSGVRRIEALTGNNARHSLNRFRNDIRVVSAELNAPIGEITARATAVVEERKKLQNELSIAKQQLALSGGGARSTQPDFVLVNGTKLLIIEVKNYDPKNLKPLADEGLLKVGSGVVAVANTASDGRGAIVVGVTSDMTSRYNAVDLVRVASEALGGKGGGGRPEMAQAGGPNGKKADAALAAIKAAMGGV